MHNKYSNKWFKDHASESIKRIDSKSWDFSDSLFFFSPKVMLEYEDIQKEGDSYYELVTKPERKHISKIASRMVDEFPDNFYYIDLGPGTEHKEKFLFDEIKKQNKKFTYIPVDINKYALKKAVDFAQNSNIKMKPILSSFEECDQYLPKDGVYRFVSLGLAFVNYNIEEILNLIKKIVGETGSCFINIQIRERVDMEEIRKLYIAQWESMIQPKMELLGLNFKKDIEDVETDNKVETWGVVKNPTPELLKKGIKSGDRILMFRSLRYNLDELKNKISKLFNNFIVLDANLSFVGFLLKRP